MVLKWFSIFQSTNTHTIKSIYGEEHSKSVFSIAGMTFTRGENIKHLSKISLSNTLHSCYHTNIRSQWFSPSKKHSVSIWIECQFFKIASFVCVCVSVFSIWNNGRVYFLSFFLSGSSMTVISPVFFFSFCFLVLSLLSMLCLQSKITLELPMKKWSRFRLTDSR